MIAVALGLSILGLVWGLCGLLLARRARRSADQAWAAARAALGRAARAERR